MNRFPDLPEGSLFSRMGHDLIRALRDILFPPLCHSCRTFIPDAPEQMICKTCLDQIRFIVAPMCIVCGTPFSATGRDHLCGHCLKSHPSFASARSAVHYEGVAKELVHGFKYSRRTHMKGLMVSLAMTSLESRGDDLPFDLVLPVPLHSSRLRKRGFNQAALISAGISKRTGIPIDFNTLRRIRSTQPQVELSVSERMQNVKGAFAVAGNENLKGRRILLVDDVYTTGSTVAECSRMLSDAGAEEVHVLTVARASLL